MNRKGIAILIALLIAAGAGMLYRRSRFAPPMQSVAEAQSASTSAGASPAQSAPPSPAAFPATTGAPPVQSSTPAAPIDRRDLESGNLTGLVTDQRNGKPLAGATVAMESGHEGPRWTTSGADGRYSLGGIPVSALQEVSVRLAGFATELQPVRLGPAMTAVLDFKLAPAGRIEATIQDETGTPIEGSTIEQLRGHGNSFLPKAISDARGIAVVEGVPVNSDSLAYSASKPGYLGAGGIKKIQFDANAVARIAIALRKIERQLATLYGTVSDAKGNPISGIRIEAVQQGDPAGLPSATTGPDGAYRLLPVEIALGHATYLRASGQGWATVANPVSPQTPPPPNNEYRVDFKLTPPHWVGGIVVDEQKNPLAGIRVVVSDEMSGFVRSGGKSSDGQNPFGAVTAADGKFRFEGLSDNRLMISVFPRGLDHPISQIAQLDKETEIVLRGPGMIRGRVTDAKTKKPVTQFTIGFGIADEPASQGDARIKFDDVEGRFEFDKISRDQLCRLGVASPGYVEHVENYVRAEAAGGPELAIELTPADLLVIALVDKNSGAPVAGASLIVGNAAGAGDVPPDAFDNPAAGSLSNVQRLTSDAAGVAVAYESDASSTILIRAAGYTSERIRPEDRQALGASGGRITIPLSHGGSISGAILLNGQIAARQGIGIASTGRAGSLPVRADIQTDAAGRYRFASLPPGEYSLSAMMQSASGSFSATRRARLADGQDLVLNFGDDGGASALYGTIVNAGVPQQRASIHLAPGFDWDYAGFAMQTNANGEYMILGLRPGTYNITIRPDPPLGLPGSDYSFKVEVGEQPTLRDFDLSPGGKVSLRLVYPSGFPADVRASMFNMLLSAEGQDTAPSIEPGGIEIDREAYAPAKGEQIVFTGHFKGAYRLNLVYQDKKNSNSMRWISLGPPVQLDNLQRDIDLGDIAVPMP